MTLNRSPVESRASAGSRGESAYPARHLYHENVASIARPAVWIFGVGDGSLLSKLHRQFSVREELDVWLVTSPKTAQRELQSSVPDAVLLDSRAATEQYEEFFRQLANAGGDHQTTILLVESQTGAGYPRDLASLFRGFEVRVIPRSLETSAIDEMLEQLHQRRTSAQHATASENVRTLKGRSVSFTTRVPQLYSVIEELELAAQHDLTVLLLGETGTGKTTIARLLHELSPRRKSKFMHVACGALQPELIESELFGHAHGAFTGADRDKTGKIEAAGKGTLLLDEIDSLSLEQQAKFLKVIESGEYERVGSNDTRNMLARLIVASNVCLEKLVEMKRFRQDLFYRLNVLAFNMPPLRERVEDIVPLAMDFVAGYCKKCEMDIPSANPEFLHALKCYHWPGNLRELKNCMERSVVLCRQGELTLRCLPPVFSEDVPPLEPAGVVPTEKKDPAVPSRTLGDKISQSEQSIIEEALRRNNNKRTAAAKELGISRVTLYNKMKRYGIV